MTASGEATVGIVTALWLGLLTSISPCPMATNVAAISYLGRRLDTSGLALGGGLLYSLGRSMVYVVLSGLFVMGLLSIPRTSRFLQLWVNQLLGPTFIVTGAVLLGLLSVSLPWPGRGVQSLGQRLESSGIWGAAGLGAICALSFCPASAALFFGSLVPLAIRFDSPWLYPAVYGLGTALPVVVFAFLITFGARHVARAFDRLTQFEVWARRVTGVAFLGVGLYMTIVYTVRPWLG